MTPRTVPAGAIVTSEGGFPVARLARPVSPGVIFAEDLFTDWRIAPLRNGMAAVDAADECGSKGFRAPDGTFWARTFFRGKDRGFVARIHVDGLGWVPGPAGH